MSGRPPIVEELAARWLPRLLAVQREIRAAIRAAQIRADLHDDPGRSPSRTVRDGEGDTIFGIDVDAEAVLLGACERWQRDECFVLVAEGIEPAGGRMFGSGTPSVRLICDPVDGSRGLMFDKRSAWSLAGIAIERGAATSLREIVVAAMTELPTTRQDRCDVLWAVRGGAAEGESVRLDDGQRQRFRPQPSQASDLRHGFATVCNFFQGGKELTARIDEDLIGRALGGWDHRKAEVYSDQYISSGGQLAEVLLGRDRFVLDIRPLVHAALGYDGTLCCKPYDLCTALIAEAAGCIVTTAGGGPLDPPLDTTTNLDFAAYANPTLAAVLGPLVTATLRDHGLLG